MVVKGIAQNKIIILSSALLFLIILIIILVSIAVGKRYSQTLNPEDQTSNPQTTTKTKKITRITLSDDSGKCIDVSPDGIVRVFASCADKDPVSVSRVVDASRIQKLYANIIGKDLQQYLVPHVGIPYFTIVITDSDGTKVTYYIPIASDSTLDDIIQDVITNSTASSPNPQNSLFSPSPSTITTIFPSPTIFPGGPSPIPSSNPEIPFTCEFIDTPQGRKPISISNTVCSTDPVTEAP